MCAETMLQPGRPGFPIAGGLICFFSTMSRPTVRLAHPCIHCLHQMD